MRVFIPCKDGVPRSTNFYTAWLGFRDMGYETVGYFKTQDLDHAKKDDVVVGGIGACRYAMNRLGVEAPSINYPKSLERYLGRSLWRSTIDRVNNDVESWPVFVKPVQDKRFTGVLVKSTADLVGCSTSGEDAEVICSEPIDFLAEWRVFVRYGEILDVRPYKGDWRKVFNPEIIEQAVGDYVDATVGYGIDFGVTSDGRTLLVEVNDGYALGSYGLQQNLYVQLLSARWSEIMGVPDELGCIGSHPGL